MAEDIDRESKTEEPTPRRREEARRQGQVPFSAELVGSVVLLAGVIALMYLGTDIWYALRDVLHHARPPQFQPDFGLEAAVALLSRTFLRVLVALGPFLGVLLAVGVAVSVAQAGFQINTEKLAPDFEKLNPAQGVSRLVSLASLVKTGLTLLKVAALAVVAYLILEGRLGVLTALSHGPLAWSVAAAWAIVLRLAVFLAAAIVGVALLDYAYQRYRFEQSLRMTKDEVKRELKEDEGDPLVKARLRQIARERTRRKMLAAVPQATVVITNPTHYAIALRYNTLQDDAPVVVARGRGGLARRIAELARQQGVVVLERPPLARTLYHSVPLGQPIPPALFRAVAEVLALVYRQRGIPRGPAQGPGGNFAPG
ncbi:MAG: flagellar biosynthesis protein FlhB [Gemmataceae bacterium]|nr:flagellar biosynthesis protein FlhB [Gemmata sp.]MDW8199011.1 flagellar biosynthesis protein FlhB [Gemmataceae bacterium]